MIKVYLGDKKNPKLSKAFNKLEELASSSKMKGLKKVDIYFYEGVVPQGSPVEIDLQAKTIKVFPQRKVAQAAIVPLSCLIYAKALIGISSNKSLWMKHFSVNKSLIKPFMKSFAKVVAKHKDLFQGDKLSTLGLAVALFRYAIYLEGGFGNKDDEKIFKKTFLPFFEDVLQEEAPVEETRLSALISETDKYASFPEKVLSTAAVDDYMPDVRKVASLADDDDLLSFVESQGIDLSNVDNITIEDIPPSVQTKIDALMVDKFMQEVLGEKEEDENGKEIDPLKGKEKKSVLFQKEMANVLSGLAGVFSGDTELPALDSQKSVKELIGNNPRFLQSFDAQAKEMTEYEGASSLSTNDKAYWKGLFETAFGDEADAEFKQFFSPVPAKEKHGYEWYSKSSEILEKVRVALSRNGMSEADSGEYFERLKSALNPPIPDPETPVITMGPIKGASRARSKILKYEQDISQLGDIVRFTVVVKNDLSNFNEVFKQMETTFEAMDARIASQIENKFAQPTPVGYGDLNFSLFFENLGLAGEVQLTTPSMAAAKEKGHILYEKTRNVEAMATAVNQVISSDKQGIDLIKALVAVRENLVDTAKAKDQVQMKGEFKSLISGIKGISTKLLETISYKEVASQFQQFAGVDLASLKKSVSDYSNNFPSLEDLADFENNCRVQYVMYNDARKIMGLEPHVNMGMLLRTTMVKGKPVINEKIKAKIESVLIAQDNNLKGKALQDKVMSELLKRDFDIKLYAPTDFDFAKQAFKKTGSLRYASVIGGFYMIEGIPYSWDGFGSLPKFFTGLNPRGCTDYEISDFLVRARPITEDVFHNRVAELTMEQAEKQEKQRAFAEDVIQAMGEKSTKTASLRNKVIRLAHKKPELRKHLLPLLKKGNNYARAIVVQDLMKQDFFEEINKKFGRYFQMYDEVNQSIAGMAVEGGSRKLPISIYYFIDYDDYGMDPSDPSYDLKGSQKALAKEHERNKVNFVKEVNQIARKHKMDFTFSIEPSKGEWYEEISFGKGIGDDEAWGSMKLHVKFSGKQIPFDQEKR